MIINKEDRDFLLIHLMEECGEVVRAASKVLRKGITISRISHLEDEIKDVEDKIDLLRKLKIIKK